MLWFHGFRSESSANRDELARIAGAGFLAAGVDAVGHGARAVLDMDALMAAAPGGALEVMLGMARSTAAEVPGIVRALAADGIADAERVSMAGVSMGGFVVYQAAPLVARLRAAVAMLGSPEWPAVDSAHRRPAAFHDVALLSITAQLDASVPPAPARRFHDALAASHPRPERARYIELAEAEHVMRAEQWRAMMDAMLEWLRRHGQ